MGDGTVWACGSNVHGNLGDGTTIQRSIPVQCIPSWGGIIVKISSGHYHTLFLKSDSTVWVCGNNIQGQLGDSTNTDRPTSVPVNPTWNNNIIDIAGGGFHSLFLKSDGSVWACGDNSYGQLGDGTYIDRNIPVQVNGLTGIVAIAAGQYHSLFVK